MKREELCCEKCVHGYVCAHKTNFWKAQEAMDKITVPIEEQEVTFLKDMLFIKPVELQCRYYMRLKEANIK
ncbi:MAG: hypothetical protein LUE29_09615 [Lachnospiraceae bacterium]|nr:hypothetical protein [Lachnospiraceae bacterium]